MAKAQNAAEPAVETVYFTIEELAAKHKVKPWIMAGVMKANNWSAGKSLTEEQFLNAIKTWLKSPMNKV